MASEGGAIVSGQPAQQDQAPPPQPQSQPQDPAATVPSLGRDHDEAGSSDNVQGRPQQQEAGKEGEAGQAGAAATGKQAQEQGQGQQLEQQAEHQQQQQDGEGDAASGEAAAAALAQAEALKREGNELFGRGMWDEAAAKYNEALDAAPASAAREKAIYFANLAACNIKTQQYAVAVQNCTEANRLDGSYVKALMRRCEAFERLEELDHALADAKALLELDAGCGWARARVAALQPRVDERTEKLKAEMFSKLKELGNTVLGKFGMSVDNFKFDKDPNTGGYNIRFER